jgi:hypothetical protein
MARPSEYSCEAASAILDIIRAGGTLEKAAEAASVSARTILRWLDADDEFRRKYAQAREDQGDWFADKIADLATDDQKEPADITARVNALKWLAAKRKLDHVGLTVEEADHVTEAREDFRFVRRLRLAIDKTSGIVGKVVVTAVVAAILAAIAKGFNVGR